MKLSNLLKKFATNRDGSFAIVAGAVTIPLLVGAGLAADYYRASSAAYTLQNAVDAAALAGAAGYQVTANQRKQVAQRFFETNEAIDGKVISLRIEVTKSRVTATASGEIDNTFMKLAGIRKSFVSRTSSAVIVEKPVCIQSLSSAKAKSIHLQGSPEISAPDCVMHSDSKSATAIYGKGNPIANTWRTQAVGGVKGRGFVTTVTTGEERLGDPFEGMAEPVPGKCINLGILKKGRHTLKPGVYCDLRLAAHSDVELKPGKYVITGGMNIKPQSTITGHRIFFDLAGPKSAFQLHANANYHVSPMLTGSNAGVLIRQRSDADSRIWGGGSVRFTGTIYAPEARITFQGSPDVTVMAHSAALIADTIKLQGNPRLSVEIDQDLPAPSAHKAVFAGVMLEK